MDEVCEPKRQPIANELLGRFSVLADRAHTLAQQTVGRLDPIMRQAGPCTENTCDVTEEQYPQLLAEYRSKLYEIENALATIEDCLNRAEI